MKRVTVILAAAGAAAVLAAALPARADDWRPNQAWQGQDQTWRDQTWPAYPGYQPVYATPPTVTDVPAPAYYAPTVVFSAPGVTVGID